ncbi:MAG: phospho-N-acetylmuramoyl-pentapeptide-transferase, partial [Clostridia bacterium]|nr:phospho-N-acetylmuramoyl-pentapeptide-transferase [Clostridia bacterium]
LLFSRWLIPALRRRRAGQPILEIGPSWHLSKAGTPTMGGLAFIAAILSVAIGWSLYLLFGEAEEDPRGLGLVLLYALLCALIGFADDFCKLAKRKNQGLTAPQKYLLQLLASALFLFLAVVIFGVDTAIKVPFSHTVWQLNGFYYPLALLYLTGMVNALNLTDGVDGLLSSTTAVIALFFLAWGYDSNEMTVVATGALLLGGALGFFCFNRHPAKVFMGDTGSLFLGGAVSAVGILTEHPLLILLAGGVFVIEALSVILQVIFFKLSHGKRLFRMAPLHHHFEKCGLGEWQVVCIFVLFSLVLAVAAYLGR